MCVWCWDSVGKAVDVPIQRYSMYPHPIPIQHQGSPDPTQTHTHHTYTTSIPPNTTPESTLLQPTQPNPTRPSTISKTLRTLSHKQTHPTHSQPDPLPHLNPTQLPHHTHYIYYRILQTLTLLPLYAHPAAKTLISPSKVHMSLGRFCCALTIETNVKHRI